MIKSITKSDLLSSFDLECIESIMKCANYLVSDSVYDFLC